MLFEAWWKHRGHLEVYDTLEDELDAVRARKKGMHYTEVSLTNIASGDRGFAEFLQMAFDHGLAVVLDHRTVRREARVASVFVLPLDQIWRVSAMRIMDETAWIEGWSNAAENQLSALIGYTAPQRARWLAFFDQVRPSWSAVTVYALLTRSQKGTVLDHGARCFGQLDELVLFTHPRSHPRPDALRRVPEGHTFARVALGSKACTALFGKSATWKRRGLMTARLTPKQMRLVNADLRSDVQFLTSRGWR